MQKIKITVEVWGDDGQREFHDYRQQLFESDDESLEVGWLLARLLKGCEMCRPLACLASAITSLMEGADGEEEVRLATAAHEVVKMWRRIDRGVASPAPPDPEEAG